MNATQIESEALALPADARASLAHGADPGSVEVLLALVAWLLLRTRDGKASQG